MKITPINGSDREFTSNRYILSFGAYGCTHLMVWALHAENPTRAEVLEMQAS